MEIEQYDIASTKVEKLIYIYFDNQYYISTLTTTTDRGYDKSVLRRERVLALKITSKIDSEEVEAILNGADRMETNIERRTVLFKLLKSKYKRLRSNFSKEKALNYQNLIGVLYNPDLSVEPRTLDIVRRKTLNVETEKDLYPPEIISLSQLAQRIERGIIAARQLAKLMGD